MGYLLPSSAESVNDKYFYIICYRTNPFKSTKLYKNSNCYFLNIQLSEVI